MGGSVSDFLDCIKRQNTDVLQLHSLTVLAHLHAKGDKSNAKVLAEYEEIKIAIQFEREQAVSSYRALVEPRILKRLILGMSIQAWSQLCGMNIMM